MAFELRARLGIDSQDRRYADESKNQLPEDVSNPSTVRDESTPTLLERLLQYRWWLLAVTSLVVVLVLYGVAVGVTIVPELLNNPFLRLALSHLFVGGLAYLVATRRAIGDIGYIDWLVLDKQGQPAVYPGWYEPAEDDEDYAKFAICKGFTLLGHRARPLTVGEVNPDITRKISATNRDLDDPAVVRLDPDYGAVRNTEYGNVLVQISDGLEVDTFGSGAVLKATLPSMADESRVERLQRTIEAIRDDKRHHEQLAEKYKQQRDRVSEQLSGPIDDIIDKAIERGVRIALAGSRTRDWEAAAEEGIAPGDMVLEDVDREVAPDE